MKHPICIRRERLVAPNRNLSLLRTPQNAVRRFLFSVHHVPSRHKPAPSCDHSQLIFYIRRCILYHVLSHLPFFADYSPISDKPFVRPSPRLSIRIELHYAVHLEVGYPSCGLKIQPPPYTRPSSMASHFEHAWRSLSGLETPHA